MKWWAIPGIILVLMVSCIVAVWYLHSHPNLLARLNEDEITVWNATHSPVSKVSIQYCGDNIQFNMIAARGSARLYHMVQPMPTNTVLTWETEDGTVHTEKLVLRPTQDVHRIGYQVHSGQGTVYAVSDPQN